MHSAFSMSILKVVDTSDKITKSSRPFLYQKGFARLSISISGAGFCGAADHRGTDPLLLMLYPAHILNEWTITNDNQV